jgi:glycerophosphoryl diester phosphodiesterase
MVRRGRPLRAFAACIAVAAAALSLAATAAASPYVHAHRGGPLATGPGGQAPAFAEQSLGGFEAAARRGFTLEMDTKLTADGVPVLLHDATLQRTTDCSGPVAAITAAELRARCEINLLGTADTTIELAPGDRRREPVPTLAEGLELARAAGVEVNLEIKNVPTDPDFDPGVAPDFAKAVATAIREARFPPSWLIVQSFWPPNLDVIEADPYFEDAATSLLTLAAANEGGPAAAAAAGYEWVSPGWPVSQAYVSEAHALGLQVVPYTLDDPEEVKAATRLGVDAIISNDPGMARTALRSQRLPAPKPPPPPSRRDCLATSADRLEPPIESYDRSDRRAPRVFAMQFKQDLRHVRSYGDFRLKIECMVREYVEPRLARNRANVVAFNEDIGLMTLATGSRGAAARAIFEGESGPSCEGQDVPCGVAAAIAAIRTGYAKETAIYTKRFPTMPTLGGTFVAGTDTFARGWMQLFSDLARRYDVYILGSNNQSPFRESRDPADIDALADPDLPRPDSVYVATRPVTYNEVFMWGPENVRREGPPMMRNVVVSNKKVPVTPIEELIDVEPGPRRGPDAIENLRPFRVPGTQARISFATSKPAFEYGHRLGEPPKGRPCADVAVTYMRCLDRLGANVVMQDEANPGRWTGPSGEGNWTPLEWMRSTWRAVADPDVDFDYNVTPHMVGNLADLPFDGQTAITQRGPARGAGAKGPGCTYVGDRTFMPGPPERDAAYLEPYAGRKREFLGIVPWVAGDGPRDELRETGAALAPGSGSEIENDYTESAIIADLPFPPNASRPRCGRGSVERAGRCRNLLVGTFRADRLRGGRRGDRIKGLGGRDRIAGGPGADCIGGGQGRDVLRGGRGADRLVGGRGADVVRGGRGNDRIDVAGGGRDRVSCGPGRDFVRADRRDRIAADCERVVRRG